MNRLAIICAREALYAYAVCHFNTPSAVCQYPRSL